MNKQANAPVPDEQMKITTSMDLFQAIFSAAFSAAWLVLPVVFAVTVFFTKGDLFWLFLANIALIIGLDFLLDLFE